MRKPIVLAIVGLLVLVGLGYWWTHRDSDRSDTIELTGNVDVRQVSLAFEGSGRIRELLVSEGQRVTAGQVLGRLDVRTPELQAESARAQIASAEQNLLRLHNGARPEELGQARARLAGAQAEVTLAEQELARLRSVSGETAGRGVAGRDIDQASAKLRQARSRVAELGEGLQLLVAGARSEDIAGAQAQVRASQAQLALIDHQIDEAELKAPVAGVVRSRLAEPGDIASPQRPVYAIALTQPKWVRVYVAETDLGRLRPGMMAQVFIDSAQGRGISGKVGYISSVAEFTPKQVETKDLRTSLVYEVRVLVDDPGDRLRLGQPATVRIRASSAGR
jgi:HlyD family secretion protein